MDSPTDGPDELDRFFDECAPMTEAEQAEGMTQYFSAILETVDEGALHQLRRRFQEAGNGSPARVMLCEIIDAEIMLRGQGSRE